MLYEFDQLTWNFLHEHFVLVTSVVDRCQPPGPMLAKNQFHQLRKRICQIGPARSARSAPKTLSPWDTCVRIWRYGYQQFKHVCASSVKP